MKTIILISTTICLCLFTELASGQCSVTSEYIYNDLYEYFRSEGISSRSTYTYGTLAAGEKAKIARTFYGGTTYILAVAGDRRAEDIDLYIYDRYGNLIEKEESSSANSAVVFTPRVTGTVYIVIKMYDTIGTYACYAMIYGYK